MRLDKLTDAFQQIAVDYTHTTLQYIELSQGLPKQQEPIVLTDAFLDVFAEKLGEQILLEAKMAGEEEPVSEGCEDDSAYQASLKELAKDCLAQFPAVKLEVAGP